MYVNNNKRCAVDFPRFSFQLVTLVPLGYSHSTQPSVPIAAATHSNFTVLTSLSIKMSSNQKKPETVESGGSVEKGVVVSSKPAGKCVRICTVLAYLFAVSFAAIVLSLYYLFIWDPQINWKVCPPVFISLISMFLEEGEWPLSSAITFIWCGL